MARKVKKQKQQQEEVGVFESPEAIQDRISKTQEFATKNKNLLSGILTVVVLIIGGVFMYQWYTERENRSAQEELFPAQFYFEKDSLYKALDGDAFSTDGLVKISDDYGMTKAGNLASFYTGVALLKQGDYDQAIEYLEKFSSDDYLVQARAYALIGDAYFEKGDYSTAVSHYKDAIDYYPNDQFTPAYLLKLAFTYEAMEDIESAKATYQTIIDDFEDASEKSKAVKFLAAIE